METTKTGVRKQKVSVSYTMKAFGSNISKLTEAKLITNEENTMLVDIYKKLIERWISIEMKI